MNKLLDLKLTGQQNGCQPLRAKVNVVRKFNEALNYLILQEVKNNVFYHNVKVFCVKKSCSTLQLYSVTSQFKFDCAIIGYEKFP